MYRLCAVNNPFVISRNHSDDLKQCIFFREVANTVYSSLREKILCLFLVNSSNMIFYTWMMDKHTDIIIWIVKDNIYIPRTFDTYNQFSSIYRIRHFAEKGTIYHKWVRVSSYLQFVPPS